MTPLPDAAPTIRLLHLEDSPRDAELIARKLEADGLSCDILRVDSKAHFETALVDGTFDAILCDFNLPDYDGVSAMKLVRQTHPHVPVILLSGSLSEVDAVKALHLGATDYLPKQRLERLAPAVTRALQEAEQRRLRAESDAALRESEERFRIFAEQSLDGFWFFLSDPPRIVYVSPSVERIWGLPASRFYSDPDIWWKVMHPEDQPRLASAWEGLITGRLRAFEEEYRVIHSDGSERWVLGTGTALPGGDNAPARFGGIVRDITARKKLEGEFLQAQKMESVGQLAGGVAHDFNNLLTVITSYSKFLMDEPAFSDEQRAFLEEIDAAASRAAALTRQLLAFSRRQALQPQLVDVDALIRNLEKLLRRLVREDIDIVIALDARQTLVWADPGQLEQVLVNLVVNARDAMPDGGTLSVRTSTPHVVDTRAEGADTPAISDCVLIEVTDTGIGMTPEVQSHIFEPFFTTKAVDVGTGLGLSTVYGIVQQSSGTIAVESAPGEGTTFRISLPRRAGRAAVAPRTAAAPLPAQRPGERVLLVEDNDQLRTVASRILRGSGYTVVEARSGHDALEQLERSQPVDLVVTDMVMPAMNGLELAAELGVRHPGVPVLFMSGYSRDAQINRGDVPPPHYLEKPFTPAALTAKVREVLDAYRDRGKVS